LRRVLVLHTGGTLGMSARRPTPLSPDAYAQTLLERVPELAELASIETKILYNLDSSDVGPAEWSVMAAEVAAARDTHDGVVIIHGTDTMAYSAAALSFAFDGLDRPVVFTGSQRPLAEVRSDARRNLVDAVDLARLDLPEVGIAFDGRLLRGNRARKGDAWSYGAFTSPACEPLARLGLDVVIAPHVRKPSRSFSLDARFDERVAVAWVAPNLEPAALERLGEGMRGLVLAAFGVGNAPLHARPVAKAVKRLVDRGVDVLIVTQSQSGTVDLSLYENGAALADAGAIGGGDMTIEAALVKTMHALGRFPGDDAPGRSARRAYLERDIAGERGDSGKHLVD
jgi:L-asparaginase